MMKYASRLVLLNRDAPNVQTATGKGFKISFEPSTTDDSYVRYTKSGKHKRKRIYPDLKPPLEVMISTESFIRAQFANQLIAAADCLLDGVPNFDDINNLIVYAVDDDDENQRIAEAFGLPHPGFSPTRFLSKPGIPLACKIAAKASFRRKHVIALNKFFISSNLHATHWIDLDPGHSPNIPLSPFPQDHLKFAYAIMIAYSIVEELQLEIRANQQNPTFINGRWNPTVKDDLERRLTEAGIDINQPISWNVRGAKKTLERRRPPKAIAKAKWAYGLVRDCDIMLIDAISDLSWIRSKITAHKVDEDIKKLSVYDVANAQQLARRLILESLGIWKQLLGTEIPEDKI